MFGGEREFASNNKEAKIQIGKSQPILTTTYTTTLGTLPSVPVFDKKTAKTFPLGIGGPNDCHRKNN